MADTQAEIILSQGLPRHIFNNLNQTSTAKEIWDNVEMLMQGSGRTLQQRKEDLFDEYERFRAIGNESIHDYFVRFHKLVNDMKITQLEIPTHQMNTKFVNNLPAYWGKYVTNVKQNMDISTTPYVQIYTHLKAYEPHAKKTLKKQEQSTSIVDPLAYVAHTTSAPALSSPSTPSPQPTAQSPNDALMATMTQIANLLSGFQKQFPPTNNQLRTSSNSRTHATVHDGHIVTEPVQRKAPGNVGNTGARGKKVICYNCRGEGHVARQCKEPKRKMDSQYFKDKALLMEAKEKGDVLDAEAEAFLADVECTAPYDQPQALTTTNMFQANHEDAYDSDVDEGPNAAVAFMANLSSTSASNNPVNEVHSNDNQIFDNVDYQLSQEMHQEEHLDSDAETEIDDNTIPYHQYLLDTEAQNVPTEVSADTSDKVSMIAILTDLQTQLDGHAKVNQEKCLEIETLKNELLQCKQEICRLDTHKVKLDLENKVRQEQALVIQRNMRNAELVQENDLLKSSLSGKEKSIAFLQSKKEKILSEKKDLADSYLDEIVCLKNANKEYWLPANERASQTSNPNRPVTPYVHKSRPPSQVLASLRNVNAAFLQFEVKKRFKGKMTYQKFDAQINFMTVLECRSYTMLCSHSSELIMELEFVNMTLDGWCESVGISHETCVPRSPPTETKVVERRNRSLMEAAPAYPYFVCLDLCAILLMTMTDVDSETVHVAFDELTDGLTSVKSTFFTSKKTQNHQVVHPLSKKSVDDLFQWFDGDEVVIDTSGVPITQFLNSLLPHQIPLPDTSDSDVETLFDHVDSHVFDTHNAPETDSEASHSKLCRHRCYPNNQLHSTQCAKMDSSTSLSRNTLLGIKTRPVSSGYSSKLSQCGALLQ
ncbi:retrovirus-related pol polyprotein from transposon TNT 1-94 [Tanacetum coccineum]